jgi:hypothetical protein
MKTKFIIFLCICLTFICAACSDDDTSTTIAETTEQTDFEKEYQEMIDSLYGFAQNHGINSAIALSELNYDYTIELQNQIECKEIVFFAVIRDIYKENNKIYLFLKDYYYPRNYYYLECKQAICDYIKNEKISSSDTIAIIAKVNNVGRMYYEVKVTDNEDDGSYLELNVDDYNFGKAIINGECIAIQATEEQ